MNAISSIPPSLAHGLNRATIGRRPWILLVVLCLVLWLPGFFTLPPIDRDESRFAQASKQMIETGDFIQIRNGLVPRNQKPIGIYWLQVPFAAAARAVGWAGVNPIWPYRLPSLIGGLAAVLATYAFGRRLAGSSAALLGAAFLAASVILVVETHMAKTDAALLGATTIAMGVMSRAWLDPARLSRRTALLFWAALGLAILVKGPIAPMVCGLTALWLAIAGRRRGAPRWLLALRPMRGGLLCAAIVLPWLVAIALATHGRFFADSVGGDLAGKLAGSDDAHGAPFGYHLALLPLLLWGGGTAAIAAVPSAWRDRAMPQTQFLVAWIVPSWLAFELVATKLPHYTLPLYPAVALLAARWMLSAGKGPGWLEKLSCGIAMLMSAALGAGALALPFIVQPGWQLSDLVGVPTSVVAAALLVLLCRGWPDPRRSATLLLCAAPLLFATLVGIELPGLRPLWIAPRIEAALTARWPAGMPAGSAFGELGFAEPSLMFVCGTQTRLFTAADQAAHFLAEGPDHVLIVDDRELDVLAHRTMTAGAAIAPIARFSGYNYSRGLRMSLTLLSAAPRRGGNSATK